MRLFLIFTTIERYLGTSAIFRILEQLLISKRGEIQFTDAIGNVYNQHLYALDFDCLRQDVNKIFVCEED